MRRTTKIILSTDDEDVPELQSLSPKVKEKERCDKCQKHFVDIEKHKICRPKAATSSDCSSVGSDSDSRLLLNEEAENKTVGGERYFSFRKGKSFTCSICQKTFKHQKGLTLHHNVEHRQPESTEEVFKMPQSQKTAMFTLQETVC